MSFAKTGSRHFPQRCREPYGAAEYGPDGERHLQPSDPRGIPQRSLVNTKLTRELIEGLEFGVL